MEEWYIPEPEVPIQAWTADIDNHIEKLENKIQKTGKDEPGWPDKFDRYHYFVKYYVIRDGEIFDTSRRYTQSLESLEELELDFKGVMKELANIASGYDNILVIEYGIQAKVISG